MSPLHQSLQTFGVQYAHRTTNTTQRDLIGLLYDDLVSQLPYDPFFTERPDFTQSLRRQQGAVDGAEYSPEARGKPCGHVFRKGETLYRCRNCGMDDTCVMCAKCFKASNHTGHDVAISLNIGSGGCCDCGDHEAWRMDIKCAYHYSQTTVEDSPQAVLPDELIELIRNSISAMLDFIVDVLSHAKNSAKPPSLDDTTSPVIDAQSAKLTGTSYNADLEDELLYEWSTVLWNDEKHNFDEVIDIVKRSCNSTKNYGKEIAARVDRRGRATVYTGVLEEAVRIAERLGRIRLGVTVRSARDVFREDMVEIMVNFLQDIANLVFTSRGGSINSEIMREIICQELCAPWRRGVAAKEQSNRSSDDDIQAVLSDEEIEDEDSEGEFNVVELEEDDDEMLETDRLIERQAQANDEETIDIDTTQERPQDIVAGRVRLIAAEITRANGINEDVAEETNDDDNDTTLPWPNQRIVLPDGRVVMDFRIDHTDDVDMLVDDTAMLQDGPWLAGQRHIKRRKRATMRPIVHPTYWQVEASSADYTTRLVQLFLYDLRLWKMARAALRDLYVTTMVAIPQFKKQMGITFATAYKELTESFLFADRDPDQSIILFSVQIFTVPSIAQLLVTQYGFLTTLLAVSYSYYSEKRILAPNEINTHASNPVDIYNFRSRRHYHILNDLRYLLSSEAVQLILPRMHDIFKQFLDWLTLFQGQNPQRRVTGEHVEYESDSWIQAFNATMQISKHIQIYADTFKKTISNDPNTDLDFAIMHCIERITEWTAGGYCEARPKFEPLMEPDESEDAVPATSFHHPLHWLLGGLLANLGLQDDLSCLQRLPTKHTNSALYPLRVIHMCWEISCDLWVRNGVSARHQLYHYSKVSTREYCLDKDIQLVQMHLAAYRHSQILQEGDLAPMEVSIGSSSLPNPCDGLNPSGGLELFMQSAFSIFSSVPAASYEGSDPKLITMQEYMFFFFITLFSERIWTTHPTAQVILTRSIRQSLVLKSQTFSELSRLMHDDTADAASLQDVVKEIAIFHPPTGLDDVGRYSLKEEQYDQVNAYYHQYSLQQINDVLEILSKRGKNPSANVKLYDLTHTPWQGMIDFVTALPFEQWIITFFSTFRDTLSRETHMLSIREGLIDKILHLLLLALSAAAEQTESSSASAKVIPRLAIEHIISMRFVTTKAWSVHRNKLSAIEELFAKLNGTSTIRDEMFDNEPIVETAQDIEFARKKAAARARQAKIMQDMQHSQTQFLMNNSNTLDQDMAETEVISSSCSSNSPNSWHYPTDNCLICQCSVMDDGRTYGTLACIRQSILDRPISLMNTEWPYLLMTRDSTMDRGVRTETTTTRLENDEWKEISIITSCGHIMHWDCFHSWEQGLRERQQSSRAAFNHLPVDGTFQCPLCRSIGNTFLPILEKNHTLLPYKIYHSNEMSEQMSFSEVVFKVNLPDAKKTSDTVESRPVTSTSPSQVYQTSTSLLKRVVRAYAGPSPQPATTTDPAWFQAFCLDLQRHTGNTLGGIGREGGLYFAHLDLLTNTIIDTEIGLRCRASLDGRDSFPESETLLDCLSDQTVLNLRVQTTLVRREIKMIDAISLGHKLHDHRIKIRFQQMRSDLFDDRSDASNDRDADYLLHEDIFRVFLEVAILQDLERWPDKLRDLVHLCLVAEMVKVAWQISLTSSKSTPNTSRPTRHLLTTLLPDLDIDLDVLDAILRHFAVAFLRKVLIAMKVCLFIDIPRITEFLRSDDELTRLLHLLQLPDFDEIFSHPLFDENLYKSWISHANTSDREYLRVSSPLPFTLIDLPSSLDELFDQCLTYKCKKCNTTPNQPALCLFCGEIVCFQSQCCWDEDSNSGECTNHLRDCSLTTGLYLIIKRASILMLDSGTGGFSHAPYLDVHGEPDPELKRGKPQYLERKRYELGIRQLFLQHQVGTKLIGRHQGSDLYDMGGWNTM